jgi:hypothetical protein
VRCAPGTGHDDAQPALGGGAAVVEHLHGHAVRGDHIDLVRHVELVERQRGGLHHRPVRVAAHDDTDQG